MFICSECLLVVEKDPNGKGPFTTEEKFVLMKHRGQCWKGYWINPWTKPHWPEGAEL